VTFATIHAYYEYAIIFSEDSHTEVINLSYKIAELFWDSFFSGQPKFNYDPRNSLEDVILENSVRWLTEFKGYFLEFGCGSSNLLLRTLCLGENKGIGVDISPESIKLSISRIQKFKLNHKANFLLGSVELLELFDKSTFEGIILSNIINCLYLEDGEKVMEESYRLLKNKGKMLLILPQYLNEETLKNHYFKPIKNNLFVSANGLIFRNYDENDISGICDYGFELIDKYCTEINSEEKLRIYHFRKKCTSDC